MQGNSCMSQKDNVELEAGIITPPLWLYMLSTFYIILHLSESLQMMKEYMNFTDTFLMFIFVQTLPDFVHSSSFNALLYDLCSYFKKYLLENNTSK